MSTIGDPRIEMRYEFVLVMPDGSTVEETVPAVLTLPIIATPTEYMGRAPGTVEVVITADVEHARIEIPAIGYGSVSVMSDALVKWVMEKHGAADVASWSLNSPS